MTYAGYRPLDIHVAPGELELVRRFLNTWSIPNDTRISTDELQPLLRDPRSWKRIFPGQPRPAAAGIKQLVRLRTCLRAMLEPGKGGEAAFDRWLSAIPVRMQGTREKGRLGVEIVSTADKTFAGRIIAITAEAVFRELWPRLKACPDCQWVFYDSTRNQSKRWCGMSKGGPGGRACGTIAKVGRFRARQRAKSAG